VPMRATEKGRETRTAARRQLF